MDEFFRNIANQEKPVSIEYFVQTDKPVIFHAGYSISSLNDVDFEKVQTLLGNDVFNLIRDEETSQEMSIFLTYELLKSNDNQWSLGATLGTDVRLPGDKIYLGLSGKLFSSWFITVAAATTELPVGVIPVSTTSGVISFESIETSREWGFVVGLSVSPF